VQRLAGAAVEHRQLAGVLGVLVPDLAEERGEPVVVVHRPAVERVVVALGALDAGAEEHLGDVLREELRGRLGLEVVDGRVLERAARRREQFADDLVERRAGPDPVAEPLVVELEPLRADAVDGADLEQLGPLHDPDVAELLAREQRIDQLLALLRVRVGEELRALGRRGEQADEVHVHAAEERLVVAHLGRHDVELVELRVDVGVDVVERRGLRVGERRAGPHDHRGPLGELVEPGQHERLARTGAGDDAVLRDGGGRVVVADEHGEPGHVAVGAVAVLRPHHDPLGLALRREHRLLREHLDADRPRGVGRVLRRAGLQPPDQQQVVLAARLDPLAAGVRHLARCLVHHQAVFGGGEVHAAAAHLPGDAEVVAVRVVPEQREHEPVLPGGRAVALAGVAPDPGEDRHHVGAEPHVAGRARVGDRDRHLHRVRPEGDGERGGPVGGRGEEGVLHLGDRLVEHERCRGGHVPGAAVGELGLHDEPLTVPRAGQFDRGRRDGDPHGLGRGGREREQQG
jgi:hypothetical protein